MLWPVTLMLGEHPQMNAGRLFLVAISAWESKAIHGNFHVEDVLCVASA
jgi:hypothetical protein